MTDEWYGFKRTIFDFNGYEAWIVEPKNAARGLPWTWCMEWPTAFVKRTGVPELLAKGFHHVHIKVPGYACEGSLKVYRAFQEYLISSGLAPKAKLIGMSFGGLYSFRYAAANQEMVERIYADAPVCSFRNFRHFDLVQQPYGLNSADGVENDPRLPINLTDKLVGIPVFLIYGADDLVVPPADNCEIFIERFQKRGGNIQVIKRNLWGHHPHGLDDTAPILNFFCENNFL